jgi:hypothetical protein|tara:strand:- start:25 stop:405 length:381 start_codon:yes stop_codon:yes gene_type:complete
MKKIVSMLLLLLSTGCFDIIGSNDVFELNSVNLIITETEASNSQWKVYGTVVNTGDTTILAPWYIEAMFYADSTFSTTFGGDNERMNFPLEPGVTSYWTLDHRSESVIEADYPDFKIKDLRAFIKK